MNGPKTYSFSDRMTMSQGIASEDGIGTILLENIPGAVTVEKASSQDDRNGTDWWVRRFSEYDLSIDCKVREEDWAAKPIPARADDIALEIWSKREQKIKGWTLRQDKRMDYILWLWKDTGRWCLIPFPMLCAVFLKHGPEWCHKDGGYKRRVQRSAGLGGEQWTSECVFVPRDVIWSAIISTFGGSPAGTQPGPPRPTSEG